MLRGNGITLKNKPVLMANLITRAAGLFVRSAPPFHRCTEPTANAFISYVCLVVLTAAVMAEHLLTA